MFSTRFWLPSVLAAFITGSTAFDLRDNSTVPSLQLNVTAITAYNRSSVFECWSLDTPLVSSNQPGINGFAATFGDIANMTYSVVPPNYNGGVHVAPRNQWLIKIAGHGVVTLPDDPSQAAYISDPESSFLFAMDTAEISDRGHISTYPGNTQTIIMQIPTLDNMVPEHTVLHSGPCAAKDYIGLRSIGFS